MARKRSRKVLSPSSYRVVMDWWVAVGVVISLLALVAIIPMIIWSGLSPIVILSSLIIIAFFILSIVDVAFFTYYIINADGLVITSQLRRYVLPFKSMTAVRSVGLRGLFTYARRKRFSLSAKGYDIALDDSMWRVISVSPELRDQFLDTLLTRIESERSAHATVEI